MFSLSYSSEKRIQGRSVFNLHSIILLLIFLFRVQFKILCFFTLRVAAWKRTVIHKWALHQYISEVMWSRLCIIQNWELKLSEVLQHWQVWAGDLFKLFIFMCLACWLWSTSIVVVYPLTDVKGPGLIPEADTSHFGVVLGRGVFSTFSIVCIESTT